MTYLLDVNALLALGFANHEHHGRASAWVADLGQDDVLATCAISEIGFVRVLNQAPNYRISISESRGFIRRLRENGKRRVVFLPDTTGAADLPDWVKTGRQTTDGHLLSLARAHGAQLATFDEGIPGGFLIP